MIACAKIILIDKPGTNRIFWAKKIEAKGLTTSFF